MVVSVKVLMFCASVRRMASTPSAASAKSGKMGFGKAILEGLHCLPIRFEVAKIFESGAF